MPRNGHVEMRVTHFSNTDLKEIVPGFFLSFITRHSARSSLIIPVKHLILRGRFFAAPSKSSLLVRCHFSPSLPIISFDSTDSTVTPGFRYLYSLPRNQSALSNDGPKGEGKIRGVEHCRS